MAELDEKYGPNFRLKYYSADVLESFIVYDWNCGLESHYMFDEKTQWQVAPTLENMEDAYNLKFPETEGRENEIYSIITSDRKNYPNVAIWAMSITPLDAFFGLRMMENAMLDFYDYPEECSYIISSYSKKLVKLVEGLKYCDVDVLYLAGDICSSKGPMLSEEMLRQYCFDPIKPAIDKAHELGLKVFYHTDGAVKDILHLFVEYGIDGINPLQPTLNDCEKFSKKYGDKLMIYGGMDNCFAIPNGTVDTVREHIISQYKTLGKHNGLIFSSHDIPDYVPQENFDEVVATIKSIKP